MRRLAAAFLLVPGLAFASPDGQQIALHGNANGALPCAACHGVAGAGNASIGAPALAGRPVGEITGDLAAMARGQGGNALMQRIARALSPAEAAAVANYFGGMKPAVGSGSANE